jgi:hypothetical protein
MIQEFKTRTKNFVENGYTNGISKSKKKKPEDHKHYKELLESKGVAFHDSSGVNKEGNNLYSFRNSCLQSGDDVLVVDDNDDNGDSTVVSTVAPPPNRYRKYHDLLVVNCPGYLTIFKLRGVKNEYWFKVAVKFDQFEDDEKKQKTIDVILPYKIEKKLNPLRKFLNNISAPLVLNAYYSGETSTLSQKNKKFVNWLKTVNDFKFDTKDSEHVKASRGRVKFFAYLKNKHDKLHVDLSFLDEFETSETTTEFFDAATTFCGLGASNARLLEFHFKNKKTAAERAKLPLTKYVNSHGDKVGLTCQTLKSLKTPLQKKAAKILISDAFQDVLPCYRAYFDEANKLNETDKTQFRSELEQPHALTEDNSNILSATVVVSSKKRKRDIEKKE